MDTPVDGERGRGVGASISGERKRRLPDSTRSSFARARVDIGTRPPQEVGLTRSTSPGDTRTISACSAIVVARADQTPKRRPRQMTRSLRTNRGLVKRREVASCGAAVVQTGTMTAPVSSVRIDLARISSEYALLGSQWPCLRRSQAQCENGTEFPSLQARVEAAGIRHKYIKGGARSRTQGQRVIALR